MKTFLLNEIAKPFIHRIASAAGMFLGATGFFSDGDAATVASAATVLGGFLVDFLVRKAL